MLNDRPLIVINYDFRHDGLIDLIPLSINYRYGLPLSFLHCTIYQQNIWREGDERLAEEQKRTWKKFFGLIDNAIAKSTSILNISVEKPSSINKIVDTIENTNFKNCWNTKVSNMFSGIDLLVNKPSYAACRFYRWLKPINDNPHKKELAN